MSVLWLLALICAANAADVPFYPYRRGKTLTFEGDEAGLPLNLSPYVASNRIREARDLSLVTGLTPNITSYSGFFTTDDECDSALFYWFFPSQNKPESDPVSVWLQGGPGSSSLLGLLTENGPYNLRTDGKLELRQYSWNRNSSMIFIDNPVGTGYSYTNNNLSDCYVSNQTQVGEQLLVFLEQFFEVYPEYSKNPFFLTGQSYAGKYVPAAAYAIMEANSSINLQGIMIGNGWVDPINQQDYSAYMYQLGLVDSSTRDVMRVFEEMAVAAADDGDYVTAETYSNTAVDIGYSESALYSIYNYLHTEGVPGPDIDAFVSQAAVRSALHVGNATWNGERDPVYSYLINDIMQSVRPWLEELLEKYRVLLYNGQLDIICPYPLTINFVQKMNWSKADEYHQARRRIWSVGNSVAGYAKSAGDFTEVLVRNSGHMVPTDNPEWALDLYNRFIFNQTIGVWHDGY